MTLKMWNKLHLNPLGTCRLIMKNPANGERYSVQFVIVAQYLQPIHGKRASEQMDLIHITYDNFLVASVDGITKYDEVFSDEIGDLPGTVHLQVDENVTPTALPARRLPVHLKDKVKKEMVQLNVLETVDEPSTWVSQMVVTTKKSGEPHICIDPKALNSALKR